ncbi:hypothetical protein ACTFIV_003745 [Dictyostelium citrinum]
MFVLQIHSVTFYNSSTQTKSRNVFLDISNENQPSRRYFVGRFSTSSTKSCESIIHISKTPITVHLSYGPLMYHDLGPQTIYDFLYEDKKNLGQKKFLTFGRRGPLYHVCYSIQPVKYSYGFSLSRISCLKQITSYKDQLYAEVEFNHSTQSIGPGPTNRYHLGSFVSHDVTDIHSVHNLSFQSLVNFVLTFYIKTSTAEYVLGTLKFTPIYEMPNNNSSSSNSSINNSNNSNKLSPTLPPILTTNSVANSNSNNNNNNNNNNNYSNWIIKTNDINDLKDKQNTGGLYCYRNSDDNVHTFLQNESSISKKITLTSPEGKGSYEFVFNLLKTDFMMISSTQDNQNQTTNYEAEHIDFNHKYQINSTSTLKFSNQQLQQQQQQNQKLPSDQTNEYNQSNISNNNDSLEISTNSFSIQTEDNQVEVLIDGLQTFRRYYEIMMNSQHSISILAWELTFSFGLVMTKNVKSELPQHVDPMSKWITLEDVLISKVLDGVNVRIIVWRHELLSHVTRFLYLGEVTIEREVSKLEKRCKRLGVVCNVFHTHNMPGLDSEFADINSPYLHYDHSKSQSSKNNNQNNNTNNQNNNNQNNNYSSSGTSEKLKNDKKKKQHIPSITVVIVGNPQGILSSHHEKLLLADSECPDHCVAFTGGFDIARGRYDQPLHQIPRPYIPVNINKSTNSTTSTTPIPPSTIPISTQKSSTLNNNDKQQQQQHHNQIQEEIEEEPQLLNTNNNVLSNKPIRYTGRNVQPILRQIRFLWHDIQILLRGPSTQHLRLHFFQRWIHAFSQNVSITRTASLDVLPSSITCTKNHNTLPKQHVIHNDPAKVYNHCSVRLFRTWKGVIDNNMMFDEYGKMILNAKEFLYVEHQYPFQNFTLTYYMCEALKANPKLHLLVVTPVKTDLPSGLVGELFDWSQDHIIKHLHLIHSIAPDRVGIYGLVQQDHETNRLKPIYIHSKLFIVDDTILNVGSTNMDNMSFFHSSELCASITEPKLAKETRVTLAKEHLGKHYTKSMESNFIDMFNAFRKVSEENYERLRYKRLLIGRPISLTPANKYEFILKKIYYPNKFTKILYKMGLDSEEWLNKMFNPSSWMNLFKPKL